MSARPRWSNASGPLVGLALLLPLAAFDGGYFPTAWGWSALALAATALTAACVRTRVRLSTHELVFLLALVCLAAWVLLSLLWTSTPTGTVLEGQRAVVYVAGGLAVLLLVSRRSAPGLLVGIWAASSLVSGYALLTRLLPETQSAFDPIAGYRLAEPFGYWNALGLFAAIGALLALALAARAPGLLFRALAAATLVVLLATLYFTFSRGAWLALGVGLLAIAVVDRRRLRFVAALLVIAPWPAAGVLLASRPGSLTRLDADLAAASREGHRLLVALAVLAVVSAFAALGFATLERRLSPGPALRKGFAILVTAVVTGSLGALALGSGGAAVLPAALTAPAPPHDPDLNRHLVILSDSGRSVQWRAALADWAAHPWLGSGAGTFERYWLQHRPIPGKVRDAHSLYLETLAELGPVGLALLLAALAAPLVAGWKARRRPLVPAAIAAYVAYLLHAGIDWDWEMPALTLAALLCGTVLLVSVRRAHAARTSIRLRLGTLALVLPLAAFALIGLIGNRAVVVSAEASKAARWPQAAAEARRAMRWAPWSTEPWRRLAEVQLRLGDASAARGSLRRAIAKEPDDWSLWLALAQASEGAAQRRALAAAARLNPLSPEVETFRANIGYEAPIFALGTE